MPTFKYIARSSDGKRVDGSLEAADRQRAMQMLGQMGHTPLSITELAGKAAKIKSGKKKRFKFESGSGRSPRMKAREMLLFTRELADLLSSGMTLGRALHTLAQRNTESVQGQIVQRLRNEVVQGCSLSEALKIYPDTFAQLYVSMVRAGEASGALSEALASLCHHYERVQEARSKVVGAMIYPVIVMFVGVLSLAGLMIFIVPRFASIFEDLGGTLPLPTRIMMGISDGLIHYGVFILAGLIAGGIAFRKWIKTPKGELWSHRQQLRLPVVRKVARANAFAHFSRTLETLIRNGVPILRALSIVQETVGNRIIAKEIAAARDRVTDGSSISGPLAAGKVFPELLTDMLSVGEETGDLPSALKNITRRYDDELDQSIKVLTTVLEPLLIVIVAAIVGFAAISMLMAVFDLSSGLGA